MTTSFYGWRVGGNLTPEEADQLEPVIDQFEYVLGQIKMYLSYGGLETQNDHILRILTVLGEASENTHLINRVFNEATKNGIEELPINKKKELAVYAENLLKRMVDVAALALLSAVMINGFIRSFDE